MSFHRLLERQLKRIFGLEPESVASFMAQLRDPEAPAAGSPDQVPLPLPELLQQLPDLLERVSESYTQSDRDLALVRRSLELSSSELTGANIRLFEEGKVMAQALSTLKDAFALLLEGYGGEGEHGADFTLADISEKVLWLIREREHMRQALKESEERFDLAMRGSNDGLWDWNLEAGTVYFSPRWKEMIGYQDHEIGNSPEEWSTRIHPDDMPSIKESLEDYLQGKTPIYDSMFRFRHRDGSFLWILTRGRAVWNEQGKPVRLVGTHTDLSELKNTEMQLQLAKEKAEKASQAKSDFLSSMSHELRTPLNAILGFGQILQQDKSMPAPQRDASREIVKAGRHLLSLINEVLDLARIESGKVDVSLVPVSLAQTFAEVQSLAEPVARQQGITLQFSPAPDQAVNADPVRLKQVLLNLVTNAIKYNRDQGKVDVIVDAGENDAWRISVMDTGPGITAEKQAQLFQPFNRLGQEGGTIQGTGIGLVITKKYVEGMGGRIGLVSRVGKGSIFWVEFSRAEPLAVSVCPGTPVGTESAIDAAGLEDPLAAIAKAHTSSAAANAAPNVDVTRKVLYVDDNAINLMLMEGLLEDRADLQILTLDDPCECMSLARQQQPALIMLDIFMPQMDGFAVLEKLRGDETLKRIPVVAVTANAMQHDIDKAMQAGFDDYLTKPIELDQLNAMLKKML